MVLLANLVTFTFSFFFRETGIGELVTSDSLDQFNKITMNPHLIYFKENILYKNCCFFAIASFLKTENTTDQQTQFCVYRAFVFWIRVHSPLRTGLTSLLQGPVYLRY